MSEKNEIEKDYKREELLRTLRQAVADQKSIRNLVRLIYEHYGVSTHNISMVIGAFMDAFHLSFGQVKAVAEAECAGSAEILDDEAIDRLLLPLMREALGE